MTTHFKISSILLTKVSWDNIYLKFKNPFKLIPYIDNGLRIQEFKIGLFVVACNREDLIDYINEEIVAMWKKCVKGNEDDLSDYDKKLKVKLLEHLEEINEKLQLR
jgi:hypothetical protein